MKLYNANCLDILKTLGDCSVDLIATDPPYKVTSRGCSGTMGGYWKEEKAAKEKAYELLSIFNMEDVAEEKAGSLPYGAQRRVEILRALATNPKLLLLFVCNCICLW